MGIASPILAGPINRIGNALPCEILPINGTDRRSEFDNAFVMNRKHTSVRFMLAACEHKLRYIVDYQGSACRRTTLQRKQYRSAPFSNPYVRRSIRGRVVNCRFCKTTNTPPLRATIITTPLPQAEHAERFSPRMGPRVATMFPAPSGLQPARRSSSTPNLASLLVSPARRASLVAASPARATGRL